jgi:hypothetical protein
MKSLLLPWAALAAALVSTGITTAAFAGLNPVFSLPLHAKASSFEPCDGYLPVDCRVNIPVVNITAGPIAIFLFVANYDAVAGVQTAFQPDPSWTFTFGLWDCQPGQLNAVTPGPPFGPAAGTITTAFNCLTGPDLGVIGRMFFVAGSAGCLEQIQSTYPFGIHVLDCQQGIDQASIYDPWRLGKVCVGPGGLAACWPPQPAVTRRTWGGIKAQYE